MSNITPSKPSFVFGYWRPWKENSNLFDSYLDYARDTSLVKYGANIVGKYINQASKEQVKAINQLGQAIGRGMNVLSNQMSDINETLVFLNRNMDVQIEQQKLSNLLLQNIAELLRVPDSEKERQHSIELGIKFFVNASKDADLYADALEELLEAEALMKQDYFVLHRIGFIYLYVEKYINPEKALEYFLRAAKYASVESDSKAARLANVLTNNFNTVNSDINNYEKQIGLLAADSYEKAAFSAYVLGRFSDAVNYQAKALKFNETPQNRFILSKYHIRNGEINEGINNLSKCIDDEPIYAVASFKEIDLINEPEVLKLISNKNQEIDNKIGKLLVKWQTVESTKASNVIKELAELSQKSYETKVSEYKAFEKVANKINKNIGVIESKIDSYISVIRKKTFCTFDTNKIQSLIEELTIAKDLPVEKMKGEFDRIQKIVDADELKIGSHYGGGIVFYIDKTGKHGLVCADKDFGEAVWGGDGTIGAEGNGIADGSGMENTKKIVEQASWFIDKGFFSSTKRPAPTAARLCLESNYAGYTDWYLPTLSELRELILMYETLEKRKLGNFEWKDYWSSREVSAESAWSLNFSTENASIRMKSFPRYVRAVRAFEVYVEVEWVDIPAGTFMMGSPENEKDRDDEGGPQHQVTLSGFKMSKYAVTFAQYDAFCEATGRSKPSDEGWGRGNRPVINVDWDDATAFAEWMGCRLPTEAEWEYACRAGTSTPFNTGDCLSTAQANYDGNYPYSNCIKGSYLERTQPVGSYAPNAWGLYDMHGNVLEWCSEWAAEYSSASQTNPTGPASGSGRVLRGGSWYSNGGYCRSAYRINCVPSYRSRRLGFRLVVPS